MSLGHRHFLRGKEIRSIIEDIKRALPSLANLNLEDRRIEVTTLAPDRQLILTDDRPAFLRTERDLLPTLLNIEALEALPVITVDAGAIPHICNGSNLMAPGIVKIAGFFEKDSVVVVVEQTYGKRIAIVRTLLDSQTMMITKRGKVAINIHYVGDKLWGMYRPLG